MKFDSELIAGILLRRYKRFLADIQIDSGEVVTALCPNTGSMKTCSEPGSPVLISRSGNPKRKLKYTWELIETNGVWAGINTGLPNKLVRESIEAGQIPELADYSSVRAEVKYGKNSRIDLLLERGEERCYVEIKNVTLVEGNRALFPDAVTLRGKKHLRELEQMVRNGYRGIIFFLVQRADGQTLSPADSIDPEYGRLLRWAVQNGVEALAYQASVSPKEIKVSHRLPVVLD